jgi:DNA-binding transcriptional ArsR family regulator
MRKVPFTSATIESMSADSNRLNLTEASSLRAMAHPARVAALTHLMHVGDATATELGDIVGLSASAMSYHLRILERAGLAETAPGRGDGRERVWRSVHSGISMDTDVEASSDMQLASVEFLEAFLMAQELAARQFLVSAANDAELLNRSQFVEGVLALTPAELEQLGAAMQKLISPYIKRTRTDTPDGASEYSMVYRAFPSSGSTLHDVQPETHARSDSD